MSSENYNPGSSIIRSFFEQALNGYELVSVSVVDEDEKDCGCTLEQQLECVTRQAEELKSAFDEQSKLLQSASSLLDRYGVATDELIAENTRLEEVVALQETRIARYEGLIDMFMNDEEVDD
jgi:hypothetical protein